MGSRFVRLSVLAIAHVLAVKGAIAQQVGFQEISVPGPGGASIPVDIWYPTTAPSRAMPLGLFKQDVATDAPIRGTGLRLIVISHGNGGTKEEHYDTALALARAGFVAAALEHTGDNYRDQSNATDVLSRPRELHTVLEYLLSNWAGHDALNNAQVGAFGFSSGGFTVLAAAGGNPDLSLVAPHCEKHPGSYDCALISAHAHSAQAPRPVVRDPD